MSLGTAPRGFMTTSRKTRSTSRLSSRFVDSSTSQMTQTTTRLESSSFEFRRVSSIRWQNSALSFSFRESTENSKSWASYGFGSGFLCDSNWVVSEIRSLPSVTCCPCDREQQEDGHIGQEISKAFTSFHQEILPTSTNIYSSMNTYRDNSSHLSYVMHCQFHFELLQKSRILLSGRRWETRGIEHLQVTDPESNLVQRWSVRRL